MTSSAAFSGFFASTSVFGLSALLALAGACSSDEKSTAAASAGQSAAGAPGGAGEGSAAGGAPTSGGGSSLPGGAPDTAMGGEPAAAGAPTGAAGAPSGSGDCLVELSMNTSNVSDSSPLDQTCRAITYDGQINFDISNGEAISGRDLNIDFFESPVAGASVKLEDGNDPQAGKGAAASYIDAAGVWNADSGTISIVSENAGFYVVKLVNVHFIVIPGPDQPTNTGTFVANGTISAAAMPSM